MLFSKIDLSYKMFTCLASHCPPYSYRLIRLWLFECKTILRSVKNAHQFVCNDLMVGKCDTIVGKLLAKLVDQKEGPESRSGGCSGKREIQSRVSSKRAGKSVCSHLSPVN